MGTGEELEKLFLHWLCRLEGLGPVTVQRIGAFAGGFRNAYYIEGMELKKAGILKREESCHRFDALEKRISFHGRGVLPSGRPGDPFYYPAGPGISEPAPSYV